MEVELPHFDIDSNADLGELLYAQANYITPTIKVEGDFDGSKVNLPSEGEKFF